MIEVLDTARLRLRPVRIEDHGELFAHWTSAEVRRFLFDGAILSAADITRVIEASVRGFAESNSALWLINATGTARSLGTAGLRPLEDLGIEVFYSLAPAAWGHGYATEVARAVVQYALGHLGLQEMFAEIDAANLASVAVVQRLGMVPVEVVAGELGPMTRYRIEPE